MGMGDPAEGALLEHMEHIIRAQWYHQACRAAAFLFPLATVAGRWYSSGGSCEMEMWTLPGGVREGTHRAGLAKAALEEDM